MTQMEMEIIGQYEPKEKSRLTQQEQITSLPSATTKSASGLTANSQ